MHPRLCSSEVLSRCLARRAAVTAVFHAEPRLEPLSLESARVRLIRITLFRVLVAASLQSVTAGILALL